MNEHIMHKTYFATYLHALDQLDDVEGVLGDEYPIHPPEPDHGYDCTPRNAMTFGAMGVDGVHYAILTIDCVVRDDSPVIQICPMDFDDLYQVKAESFLAFLAAACDVSVREMEAIFITEQEGKLTLVEFLRTQFKMSRLWDDERNKRLAGYLAYIVPKT